MALQRITPLLILALTFLWPTLALAHGITEGDQQAMLAGGNL
jgi:hypothetical protein